MNSQMVIPRGLGLWTTPPSLKRASLLEHPFSEEEIKEVIFKMNNKP